MCSGDGAPGSEEVGTGGRDGEEGCLEGTVRPRVEWSRRVDWYTGVTVDQRYEQDVRHKRCDIGYHRREWVPLPGPSGTGSGVRILSLSRRLTGGTEGGVFDFCGRIEGTVSPDPGGGREGDGPLRSQPQCPSWTS